MTKTAAASIRPLKPPYISVAFTNRNDDYGGDLESRINKFIDYYAYYAARWPDLFEFVICDWNPPSDKAKLREAFPWDKLGRVVHVEVPPDVHQKVAGARGRKMLDYIGRNVAARRGSGEFVLVMNQDIFISETILTEISSRNLSAEAFYRADRCDFDYEPCRDVAPEQFEAAALQNVCAVNRRHMPPIDWKISVPTTAQTLRDDGFALVPGDDYDSNRGLITCNGASRTYRMDKFLGRIVEGLPILVPVLSKWMPENPMGTWCKHYLSNEYYRQFFLHTNASGDFIIASRQAFFDIQGMIETTDFYMHLDTYAILQLFAAGYKQIIFAQPHRVFHADHDRSGRADFQEPMTWAEHELRMSQLIRNKKAYKINGENWGLSSFNIPVFY